MQNTDTFTKGDEFWLLEISDHGDLHAEPLLMRGVVIGGGSEVVIGQWDRLPYTDGPPDGRKFREQRYRFDRMVSWTPEQAIQAGLADLRRIHRDATRRAETAANAISVARAMQEQFESGAR